MPHALSTLVAIAAIWFAATVTPGPDFLVTSRTAMVYGREAAHRTVFGLALGTAAWGLGGFFGVHALFLAAPFLYVALKLGAGAYLCWLGGRLLFGSIQPASATHAEPRALRAGSAFRLGLITNLANPKAALFTASMFAATLPSRPPVWLGLASACIMVSIALGWYSLVVRLLTMSRIAAAYKRAGRWVDRVAGAAFAAIGLRLLWESRA
jgi:threonine/homoserine/homoserine lactone efflux protein